MQRQVTSRRIPLWRRRLGGWPSWGHSSHVHSGPPPPPGSLRPGVASRAPTTSPPMKWCGTTRRAAPTPPRAGRSTRPRSRGWRPGRTSPVARPRKRSTASTPTPRSRRSSRTRRSGCTSASLARSCAPRSATPSGSSSATTRSSPPPCTRTACSTTRTPKARTTTTARRAATRPMTPCRPALPIPTPGRCPSAPARRRTKAAPRSGCITRTTTRSATSRAA